MILRRGAYPVHMKDWKNKDEEKNNIEKNADHMPMYDSAACNTGSGKKE